MNHPGNNSPKPLNWRPPQIEERVEKSRKDDGTSIAGTPVTRSGMYNGTVPSLRPNPAMHKGPDLILKADGPQEGQRGGKTVGPRGGKIAGRTSSGHPLYQTQVVPGAHHPTKGDKTRMTHGQHGDQLPGQGQGASDPHMQAQIDAIAQQLQGHGGGGAPAAHPTGGGGGAHVGASGGSAEGSVPRDQATSHAAGGGGGSHVQHVQASPHGSGQSSAPPQHHDSGDGMPPGGGGGGGPQQNKPPGMGAGPGAGHHQVMQPTGQQGVQPPGGGQPSIPGMPSMAPAPQAMMNQPMQQPIGFTPDGLPIYPDPFHPQHQMFQKPEHQAAAEAMQQQGNPMAAQAHQQLAQEKMSPMDRAQEKYSANPNDMMSTTPPGGRTNLPGQPIPNPHQKPQMDTGHPHAPHTPNLPGQEREGPKPGMHEQPPPADGAPHLAKPQAPMMPPSGPDAGPAMQGQGDHMNMMEALQQIMQHHQTGAPAPSPGSSAVQGPQGMPKPVGMQAPPTNAGAHAQKVEDAAQKSLIDLLKE